MVTPFVEQSSVLHRAMDVHPETVVSASGISLTLASGRRILDASAGPSVSCIGQGRPEVSEAIARQLSSVAYVYSGARFTSQAAEDLAALLCANSPFSKAIFVNSGSEATDAALKLATQYWHERGQPQKRIFIGRKQSYHGNTIGALSVSGHEARRETYACWLADKASFVDPCFPYRLQAAGESDAAYVKRLADQLEAEIVRLGAENVSAFIAETVSGTTLGCATAVPGYFQAIRAICDKYDILLILDEIMCGLGKTGTLHAWEQEGIAGPDIQTVGKALGGGFVPLSAVLLHKKIFDALAAGSKQLMHGHTFQAHPVACAAALEVQHIIRRENLLSNVVSMGNVLEALLRREILPLPTVGNVRGRGLFWSVEFVKNKEARTPFDPALGFCNKVVVDALDNGLNILGNLGRSGSVHVDHVILSPPYIVNEAELIEIVTILRQCIERVAAQVV